jgi:hypothetical protein
MLLRGCILKNTKWVFGVVIFAGRDTKVSAFASKSISLVILIQYVLMKIILVESKLTLLFF